MKAEILRALYPNGIPVDAYDTVEAEVSVAERLIAGGVGISSPPPPPRREPKATTRKRRQMKASPDVLFDEKQLRALYPDGRAYKTAACVLEVLLEAHRPVGATHGAKRAGVSAHTFVARAKELGAVKVGPQFGSQVRWGLPAGWRMPSPLNGVASEAAA